MLTVTADIAALPVDGVWRFDEETVEYSSSSKEHMKKYVSRQLRKIIQCYEAMQQGNASQVKFLSDASWSR
eukprot:1917386-Pleurochrysis_carterae.AAC.2